MYQIIKYGNVILDLHPTATIEGNAALFLGYNLRNGSNAETIIKMHANSLFIVKGDFKVFYGSSIEIRENAMLTVEGGYINTDCLIHCEKGITIGKGAAIARYVKIYDGDFHKILDNEGNVVNKPTPIIIGGHVWVGVGATILKGVTIGDGAIIGAGAVVTHDVPSRCLAAGNPAVIIRENIEWE